MMDDDAEVTKTGIPESWINICKISHLVPDGISSPSDTSAWRFREHPRWLELLLCQI